MSYLRAALGFAVAVVVVVGAAAAGGAVLTSPEPTPETEVSVPQFGANESLVAPDGESGTIRVGGGGGKVVLVDAAHGNDYQDEELAPVVDALTAANYTVQFVGREAREPRRFNASLRRADAYVVVNPRQRFSAKQVAAVERFADAGGRVLLVEEPPEPAAFGFFGPIPSEGQSLPMSPLASALGVSFEPGYVYNMHEYDTNYRSVFGTPAASGPLVEGVSRTVFRDARAVAATDGTRLVTAGERSELSTSRTEGQYALAVRSGNVTAVGSLTVFSTAGHRTADNEVLAGNVLTFLVTGEKVPEDAPTEPDPEGPRGPGPGPGPEGPPRPPTQTAAPAVAPVNG